MADILVRELGFQDYATCMKLMQNFVAERDENTQDEIWLLQHPPVYTQGTGCDAVTLVPSEIPVVKSDRGGQITYHGPGQIIMYPLLRLKRFGLGIKSMVNLLEQTSIDILADYAIAAERRQGAPGVYVADQKISALGLRVKRGSTYHGLSLNVSMDLSPFSNIDPCGYKGLEVTQVSDFVADIDYSDLEQRLAGHFIYLVQQHYEATQL